jgi:hypothetical protein
VPAHSFTPGSGTALGLPVARRWELALNAGWDGEVLRAEMSALELDGFDLAVAGFSADELLALMAAPEPEAAVNAEEEPIPEPPAQPVTLPGDVWLIGPHRLICGDCRDAAVVARLMAGASASVCPDCVRAPSRACKISCNCGCAIIPQRRGANREAHPL